MKPLEIASTKFSTKDAVISANPIQAQQTQAAKKKNATGSQYGREKKQDTNA